ncbi:MAG TPA: ATP-binding protein [Streptosporangiaceae bacterium]|nr:ATP-binding protein [Streptosporangiaceae bacterium]
MEALTNVAKHAAATEAEVSVTGDDGLLRLTISDNGHGGADLGGTGLRGLAQRVASVDGLLRISSPAGGPTVISVELPLPRPAGGRP